LEANLLTDDKGYGIRLASMGTIALVRPDTHPAKPPMPEVGEPLPGVEARPLPKGVVAELVPSPGALFMQPGLRSEVQVGLKDTEAFSSGTRVDVEIREIYQRRDDGLLSPEPRIFDLILFQEKTGLVGRFALGPSVRFEPALLEDGAISIDVYAPDTVGTSAVVSIAGGSLQTREGLSLEIPPRALTQAMPVTIRPIREPDSVLQGDPRFTVLTGFSLDFAGTVLNTPARAVLELGEALPPNAQVLVVRPILVHDLTHYELVGIAVNKGRTLVMPADETGTQALGGIRQEGRYYLVRMIEPVGYLRGSVRSKGGPTPEALVSTEQLPFVDLVTAGDSRYVLAAPIGAVSAHARDLTNGRSVTVIKALKDRGETLQVDLDLMDFRPSVVSMTPTPDSSGVPTTTPISVRFSGAMDGTTITPDTFELRAGSQKVEGTVALLPDGRTAVFRTVEPLASDTLHTLELSPDIRDSFGNPLFGNQPDDTFVATFSTLDTSPPPPPEPGQITLGPPVDGVAEVSGTQGTVEPGVVVTVRNTATDVLNTVIASDDGSFSISVKAGLTDDLELILHDAAGNETTLPIGRVTPPPGFGVMGTEGGVIEAEKGVAATVPAGFLPPDTILDVQPLDIKDMPHPFSKDFPGFIAGGVKFNMSGVEIPNVAELRFSVDGFPGFNVTDLIPLFRIERDITLPKDLQAGSTLILRLQAWDLDRRSTKLTAELPIVADSPDTTPRTIEVDGTSTLRLTLPTQAAPGERIAISAAADPPYIRLRFPAHSLLTGEEQYVLFAVREVNGKPFWDLVDRAQLKTLEDGQRIIETTSPPYSGLRRDTSELILAVTASTALAYAQVLNNSVGAFRGVTSLRHGMRGVGLATAGNMQAMGGLIGLGASIQGLQRWPDRNVNEFSVVPVRAGVPTTIEVIDPTTNERLASIGVPALPPASLSSVLILGEDDSDLQVTAATSQANYAVPVDAGISISFSHLVDTSSINDETLYIEAIGSNGGGRKVEAEFKYKESKDERSFIVTVKPRELLLPNTRHRLVAPADGIRRPNDRSLTSRFELPFTTASSFEVIGHKELPWAKAFDVVDDVVLVTQRHIRINQEDRTRSSITNRFVTVGLTDPTSPEILHEMRFEQREYDQSGPIWSVKGMQDVEFEGRDGMPIEGDLAIISLGNSGTFSTVRVFDVNNPRQPKWLSTSMVSVPLDVIHDSAKLVVIPTFGMDPYTKEDLASAPLDDKTFIGVNPKDWVEFAARTTWGKANLTWEVRDYFGANLKGIPKTTAYPWVVDTDGDHTIYFVNQGIGIMTLNLAQAIPPLPAKMRGRKFGPSYIPRDKVGALVIRDDDSLVETSDDLSITSPGHLTRADTWTVNVKGEIKNQDIAMILVNGFRAEFKRDVDDRLAGFEVEDLPVRDGVNRIRATAFAKDRRKLSETSIVVLRDFPVNPMAGPGSVKINLPPLSVAQGSSIKVTASLNWGVGRLDELYVNGKVAKYCGAKGVKICEGTVEVELQPGVNTIVATAIDLDMEIPDGPTFADMRVEEGLVLAVKDDLQLFDASGLVPLGKKVDIGKAYNVSVARSVLVDIDDDGKTPLEENADEDEDKRITVFDELKNLALVGEGAAKKLTFVDITQPHKAEVLGWMPSPTPVYRAVVLPENNWALVAAGDWVLVVDLTRAHHEGELDQDDDGTDDRILYKIPMQKGGAFDIRLDAERGLAYVLQRDVGLTVLRLEQACTRDVGIDVTRLPIERTIRYSTIKQERQSLFRGIEKGLAHAACSGFKLDATKTAETNAALLAQGSSACIWPQGGQCSSAYQPGLSDYDFEFIVPVDMIKAAKQCAIQIEKAIHKIPALKYADVSVFPVRQSVVETAYRDVEPVAKSCGGGSDKYGDLCLGRNGNILKWVLEGEWVGIGEGDRRVEFNNGIELDEVFEKLSEPIDEDSLRYDPRQGKMVPILEEQAQETEPTHIPRLEGKEWGCLEDFALNQSAARIRIKGVGLGDVPVQSPFYLKKIHKAAKAGIRAVFGKLIASDQGNPLLLGTNRGHYRSQEGCFTRTADPENVTDLKDFGFKPCESFTEYIASTALLSAKYGHGIFDQEDALLAYEMFRRKADVGAQIRDETEANRFIIKVMRFIDKKVRGSGEVDDVHRRTLRNFTDWQVRENSLNACENTHLPKFKPTPLGKGAEELKLKVPARLFNTSYVGVTGLELAFYHDDEEVTRVQADLVPGESVFFPRDIPQDDAKDRPNDNDAQEESSKDAQEAEKETKKETFKVKPKLRGHHKIQLLADPDSHFTEYGKGNNFDGFVYYLLYPDDSGDPPATDDRPKPPVPLPDPPASKICLREEEAPPSPHLELLSTVQDQYEASVDLGGELKLGWLLYNRGNVDLKKLQLQNSLVGRLEIKELSASASTQLTRHVKAPDTPQPLIGLSTVQGLDPEGNAVGPVSSAVKINVVQPVVGGPVVKIYSPPKQDPMYSTMAKKMTVWGLIDSQEPLSRVTINKTQVQTTKEAEGQYRFETQPGQEITLNIQGETEIVVVAVDQKNRRGRDAVSVRRAPSPYSPPEEDVGKLRVIKRVKALGLNNWHERVRAKPGETVEYRVRVINDGQVALHDVSVRDLDLVQKDWLGRETLALPPTEPVELAPNGQKQIDIKYDIPNDAGGGIIANTVFVGARLGARSLAASDNAQVLVDGPGPLKGDPQGGIVLSPGIILLAHPDGAPKEKVTRQLEVLRVSDGQDVTRSAATRYQTLSDILSLADKTGLTDAIMGKIDKTLASFKTDTFGKIEFKIPARATVKIDAQGKLVAEKPGITVVRAIHELPDGNKLYSNYAIVVVGIGNISGIDIQPRSFLSFGPQAGQYLINLISEKLLEKYEQRRKAGKDASEKKGSTEEKETTKLLEFNIPMILGVSGPVCGKANEWGPYLTNWIGKTGFAELVAVKFDFLGGAISGVDILQAARELLKLIPPVTVPVGPVPVPIPVGWLLAQLVGPAAAQFLDFEATGMADVRSSFPSGLVTAKGSGLGRVTGTLDLSSWGFGKGKDDFLVVVGPELLSTDVRFNAPDNDQENITLAIHAGIAEGKQKVQIPLAALAEGQATLTVTPKDRQAKNLEVVVTSKPKATPIPKGAVVLAPKQAQTIAVPMLDAAASQDIPVNVVRSEPDVVAVTKENPALVLEMGDKAEVFAFTKVGFKEKTPEKEKKPASKDDKKEEKFGISIPTSAALADYLVGERLDTYLLKKLLPVVPMLTKEDVEHYRKELLKRVLPACVYTGEMEFEVLKDEAKNRLKNLSLNMKLALTPDKDADGNPQCKLQLKAFELGFPAPNFVSTYQQEEQSSHPFRTFALKAGETEVATLKPLGGKYAGMIDWLSWLAKKGTPVPGVGSIASTSYEVMFGLGLTREVEGKSLGTTHLGVDSCIPFLGYTQYDTYKPFTGKGGGTIKVVKPKEKPPKCFAAQVTTSVNKPVSFSLLGYSYRKVKKAGEKVTLKFTGTQPAKGQQQGLPHESKRKARVTYTPGKDFVGEDRFAYRVNDGKQTSASCEVGLRVLDRKWPDCDIRDVETTMNTPKSFILQGYSPEGLPLVFERKFAAEPKSGTLEGLPVKSSLGAAKVRYVPDEDFTGPDFFHFTVSDGERTSSLCAALIEVSGIRRNKAPKALGKRHGKTPHATPVASEFVGVDEDLDDHPLTITVPAEVDRGKIKHLESVQHSRRRSVRGFVYEPREDFDGPDSVTFEVRDPYGAWDYNEVRFQVNAKPTCKDAVFRESIPKGAVRSIPIVTKDPDNDQLEVRVETLPRQGKVTGISTSVVRYQALEDAESGPDGFRFVVSDPHDASEPCTVSVTIEKDNQPPVPKSKAIVVQKNSRGNMVLLEADDNPEQRLNFAFPSRSNQGGSIVGMQRPGPHSMAVNYSAPRGYTGQDGFQFVADDGKDKSVPGLIDIRVNAPPLANDDTAQTDEEVPVVIDVLENDLDPDGVVLAVVEVESVVGADVSIVPATASERTKVRFAPLPEVSGLFEFTYTIMDNDRAFTEGKVRVAVRPVNENPAAIDDRTKTDEGVPVAIDVLANDTDSDGDELSVHTVTQAQNGRVFNDGGQVRYEPQADFSGADSFTYTVEDNHGGRDTASVDITVRPVNDPPVVPDQTVFRVCCLPTIIDVLAEATDPDGEVDPSRLEIVEPPAHGKAAVDQGKPGSVTYTPKHLYTGQDDFTIKVQDKEHAASKSAKITVTVGKTGGFINEVVRGESKVELFNPSEKSLDISNWSILGYRIGSDSTREQYKGPLVDGVAPSSEAFHTNTFLVLHLPETNLTTETIALRDAQGRKRESLDPDLNCYPGSRQLRPSLSRHLDGFDAADPCLSFRWVRTPTLGTGN
jgi:hypothetical protein